MEILRITKQNGFVHFLDWVWSLDTRAMEIVAGMCVVSRGLMILARPESMAGPTYDSFRAIMPEYMWALLCLVAGLFQIGGVLINGNWKRSPALRFVGAMIASTFFAMLTTLSLTAYPPDSLAASMFLPLTVANIWTALNIASKE